LAVENDQLPVYGIVGEKVGFVDCEVGSGAEHSRMAGGLGEMAESLFERREQTEE
jgi:hypothetical protein